MGLALAALTGRLVLVPILTLALFAAPSPARTQATPAVARIGVMGTDPPPRTTPRYEAFRQGLRDLGYVEGRTARALGLAIPPPVLARVDETIEQGWALSA